MQILTTIIVWLQIVTSTIAERSIKMETVGAASRMRMLALIWRTAVTISERLLFQPTWHMSCVSSALVLSLGLCAQVLLWDGRTGAAHPGANAIPADAADARGPAAARCLRAAAHAVRAGHGCAEGWRRHP